MHLYIGLMSGTSLDGVDGVLVAFDGSEDIGARPVHVLAHAHRPFQTTLKAELLALNTSGGDELHRSALAANEVARSYAAVVDTLLRSASRTSSDVCAIGAHGQTVRHRPGEFDGIGYTLQLNAPALFAELTGIDVIADFRSRDVAAGGTGAPLVPAFHRAVFGHLGRPLGVLNIGGISNLTILHDESGVLGFDCGPGNALMDLWCERRTGRPFDENGAWAAAGHVIDPLLAAMLADRYFDTAPPKSTGRDHFNGAWLDARLAELGATPDRPQDVQATLTELTARVCANALRQHGGGARRLLVCGGGALNADLMQRIAARLPGVDVSDTDRQGLPATQVEACAFAWLAQAHVQRRPGNVREATGAKGPRVLGALYPAGIPEALPDVAATQEPR